MNYLLEAIPIVFAVIAIFACGARALQTHDSVIRRINLASLLAAVLMIIAQSSWAWTHLIKGSSVDSGLADNLWTVLNALVMTIFIYSARKSE